jgi:acyl carrier protein
VRLGGFLLRDEMETPVQKDAKEEVIFSAIKAFLEQNAGTAIVHPVEPQTLLLNSALDSFTVLQLMMFLSEQFQFELQEEDFIEEHFGTVGALVARVAAKRRTS